MKVSYERSYKLERMKSHSFLIFIIIFVIYSLTISYVRAEITEKEIGVPCILDQGKSRVAFRQKQIKITLRFETSHSLLQTASKSTHLLPEKAW